MFTTIRLCSFLTRYKPKNKMAAITVAIIVMTGMHSPNIIQFGLFRVIEICLGILCGTAVSLMVFPRKKADVLRKNLETQGYDIIMAKELIAISKASGEALVALMKNDPSFDKTGLERLVQEVDSKLCYIRKEGLTSRFDVKRLVQVFSFFSSLKYFAEDILSGADKISSNQPIH